MDDFLYVNYGCGWTAPDGWLNFDSSLTLRFERLPLIGGLYTKNAKRFPGNVRVGDIVRGLPVRRGSCKGVYCSHVLEHLSLEACCHVLRNTFDLLQPGGVFRLVLPDLEYLIGCYSVNSSTDAAHEFVRALGMGREHEPVGLMARLISLLGNSRHYWMWDYKSLEAELRYTGFIHVRRAKIGDADDPKFRDVETTGRWENALGIEAIKPA